MFKWWVGVGGRVGGVGMQADRQAGGRVDDNSNGGGISHRTILLAVCHGSLCGACTLPCCLRVLPCRGCCIHATVPLHYPRNMQSTGGARILRTSDIEIANNAGSPFRGRCLRMKCMEGLALPNRLQRDANQTRTYRHCLQRKFCCTGVVSDTA